MADYLAVIDVLIPLRSGLGLNKKMAQTKSSLGLNPFEIRAGVEQPSSFTPVAIATS